MEKYFLVKSEALLSLWLACLTLCTVGLDMKTFQGCAVVVQDAMPHSGQIGRGGGVGKRRGWGWGISSKDWHPSCIRGWEGTRQTDQL